MDKPRLLDLFCGAGGCSVGYSRAGFEPYGIDNDPKPLRHYPFPYVCMDALEAMDRLLKGEGLTFSSGETLYLADFDAYHASPPCQDYSISRHIHGAKGSEKLIPGIRLKLLKTQLPYVIENVPGAPLFSPIELSGMSFGLKIIRRRLFELNRFEILFVPVPRTETNYRRAGYIPYHHGTSVKIGYLPNIWTKERLQKAMGINWMNIKEMTQAIPPCYTCFIGGYLLSAVLGGKHRPSDFEPAHKCDTCDVRRQGIQTQNMDVLVGNVSRELPVRLGCLETAGYSLDSTQVPSVQDSRNVECGIDGQ